MQFNNIFKLLISTNSHYLTTEELGRLLLLVNKKLTSNLNINVWQLLCQHHWGYDTANSLLITTNLDAVTYFKTFASLRSNCKPWGMLPSHELRFSFQDYILLVEARIMPTNKPLFCHAIPGDSIPDFFTKGEMIRKLVNPIDLRTTPTTYPFYDVQLPHLKPEDTLDLPGWRGFVHLIRRDGVAIRLLQCSHNGTCTQHELGVLTELYPLFSQSIFMMSDIHAYDKKHCLCDGFPRRRKLFKAFHIEDHHLLDAGWTGNMNVQLRLIYQTVFNDSNTIVSLTGFHVKITWRKHGKESRLSAKGLQHILECLSECDDDVTTL
jgi:hypothetical protein